MSTTIIIIFVLLILTMFSLLTTNGFRCNRMHIIKYCSSNYRPSSSSSSSRATTKATALLSLSNQHLVDGHLCNEISITLKNNISIVLLEASAESQDKLVDIALESDDIDPYGSVIWPSSIYSAEKVFEMSKALEGKVLLDVGTGTGLVALSAALAGCHRVLALDYNIFPLKLLEKSKSLQSRSIQNVETMVFDIKNFDVRLPQADIVVFADVLYEKDLAVAVAERVYECCMRGSKILLVSPPHRIGRPWLMERLKELFKSDNSNKVIEGKSVTVDVAMPIRNSLIDIRGKYNTGEQEMFVLEL